MNDMTFHLLAIYADRDRLSLHDLGAIFNTNAEQFIAPVHYLLAHGYLEISPTYSTFHGTDLSFRAPLQITYEGRIYLDKEQKERHSYHFSQLRAWITLAIAIISILLSAFSIYLQYK